MQPSSTIATMGKQDPAKPMAPLNYFIIIGDCKPGKAEEVRKMAAGRAAAVSWGQINATLQPLTIHYALWALINNETQLIYAAVFDTDFDKYVEDAHHLFMTTGFPNFFEVMEGFPEDWKTNIPAFHKFFKERHNDSVYQFSSYPGVTVSEIEKALTVKQAFSAMLDQMQ